MRCKPQVREKTARPVRENRRQAGYALFFVLSLVLLLSLLLAGVSKDSRQQARTALRAFEAAQARADAETALSLTVMRLLAAGPEDRWRADGREPELAIGETSWRVTLTPEDGKVDLNHAPPALLTELFTAAGLSAEEAQVLADRVADWRDADDLTRLNGAERPDYENADLPRPRNGPFLKPDEIRRVMGMTEDLYACIAGAITVYSGKAGIDRRFAPPLLKPATGEAVNGSTSTVLSPPLSPLGVGSSAGMAISVHLAPRGGKQKNRAWAFVLRLTENPASPWWLLASRSDGGDRRQPDPPCVSGLRQNRPRKENSTSGG